MTEQYQIIGIKKPGGNDNRTTHITEVLVQHWPFDLDSILGAPLIGMPGFSIPPKPRPRPVWRTVESVIADIDAGHQYYYVNTEGNRAEVLAVPLMLLPRRLPGGGISPAVPSGRRFIKTKPDGTKVDNLLSLPNYYGT